MHSDHNYWFPAKRYGWGWGLPISWQGWIVLIAYFTLIDRGNLPISPKQSAGVVLEFTSPYLVVS